MRQKRSYRISQSAALAAAGLVVCWATAGSLSAADPTKDDPPGHGAAPGPGEPADDPMIRGPEPRAPGAKGAQKPASRGAPVLAIPKTPAEREKALADLYAQLAAADSEETAQRFSAQIERLWLEPRGDTVGLLMERALAAANSNQQELALKLLDAVVELQPDFAEGWNRRAYLKYSQNDVQGALGDLRRVLALDPNHFKALDGLAQVLRDVGEKKAALKAMRSLIEVHPFWAGARKAIDDLAREVDGQRI